MTPNRPKLPSQPQTDQLIDGEPEPTVLYRANRQRDELARKRTNPGFPASHVPAPPPLPLEVAKTVPAVAHQAPTQRAPSPVAVQAVRIDEAGSGQPGASLPPPSQDPRDAQIAALRAENEKLRAKPSAPPDRGAWQKLGFKLATAIVGALVLVIGALGFLGVTWANAKADAIKTAEKAKAEVERDRRRSEREWRSAVSSVLKCRHEQQAKLNARQFPESQRAAATGWPIWKDECGELPEP